MSNARVSSRRFLSPRAVALPATEKPALEAPAPKAPRTSKPQPAARPAVVPLGGFRFETHEPKPAARPKRQRAEKPTGAERSRSKVKIDPQLAAKARELRDRYLERVNTAAGAMPSQGKYDVTRSLSSAEKPTLALPHAA